MSTPIDKTSAVVAAVAISLAQEIIEQTSDENFSDMLQGNVITGAILAQMVATSAAQRLSSSTKLNQGA